MRLVGLAIASCLVLGCAPDRGVDECLQDDDCKSWEACVNGSCVLGGGGPAFDGPAFDGPAFDGSVGPPSDGPPPDGPPDAARSDAARSDAAQPDAARSDAARPDASEPDASTPDAAAHPDATSLIEWVSLRGGSFTMGSDEPGEGPPREVDIPEFEIAQSEVTVDQYQRCVDAGRCTPPVEVATCNSVEIGRQNHPVNCVDWAQAVAFATWVGGRLPSEAEWEYAARSTGLPLEYPWGPEEATCDYAIMDDGSLENSNDGCGLDRTWPVCSKNRGDTANGLCDMAGNVEEWVGDWSGRYTDAPVDGGARTEQGRATTRVTRGGSWIAPAPYLRTRARGSFRPNVTNVRLGFRVAR